VGVHEQLAKTAMNIGLHPHRVFTIRNALDIQPYLCLTHVGNERVSSWGDQPGPYGIVIANVRPSKDIVSLLNALAQVKSDPWTMAIVGGLVDKDYAQLCQNMRNSLGLEKRILFLGTCLDTLPLLAQADFAILPSMTESGPLALIEYTMAGLPFVATRVGLIGKFLSQLGLPEFVPPGDIELMAQAILRLIRLSPPERRARGESGRTIAQQYFDIQGVMPDWYAAYSTALSNTL
jgi:glycosyltransferase involved in cell wall biosynthesis